MNVGTLEIGENWKVAVNAMLFISYYWTYQVLRVSLVTELLLPSDCRSMVFAYNTNNISFTAHCHGYGGRYHWKLVVQETVRTLPHIPTGDSLQLWINLLWLPVRGVRTDFATIH